MCECMNACKASHSHICLYSMVSLDSTTSLPSLDKMREAVKEHFSFSPCTWQLKAALTQLKQNDLVTLALTGSVKTLTFWIPLLNGDGIIIIVTPLIVLGEKNLVELCLCPSQP